MATVPADVRAQLLDRRQRIETIVDAGGAAPQLQNLLHEIDQALERFSAGTYGLCETCGDPIESERLAGDPLLRFCLDHLTPSEARALEYDLDLASRVQRNLLPPEDLAADGWITAYRYHPLGTVSGDYLDLVRPAASSTDLLFLLGDIAGKGVAASMLMAHLHATVRTLIDVGLPLSQIVERANRVFCESTMASHYATLVCGRLSADGTVEICNAGHPPPIHLHDGHATLIEPTSLPVGLFCTHEYPTRQFRLEPGDSLVLYTDGVTEAFDPDDREYGVERLVSTAAANAASQPRALVAACLADVTRFRGRAVPSDDVTVMVIRRA